MNRILLLAILLAIILGDSTLFAQIAQTRSGKPFNAAKDSLVINSAKDTLTTNTAKYTLASETSKDSLAIRTTSYRTVTHCDSVHNYSKNAYNKDVFKFKNDAFREKMNKLRLSELLINIFFK